MRTANVEQPRDYADIVVGGQAGSEGKGALVAHLLRENNYAAAVRPGSSNAGHTVYDDDGESYVHQVIPSAATVTDDVDCLMAPESSFGLDEFFEEFQDMVDRWGTKNARDRMVIDKKAAIITHEHRKTETNKKLGKDIGSTVHGCGAVRVEKIWRSAGNVRLAEQYEGLLDFVSHQRVPEILTWHGANNEPVIVEGTQGTLLSMNQSPHWPFSTSRDCVASSFLSSCGLPPSASRDVWAVFRTYPIRVGGFSGPMDGEEIDFKTIAERAGHDTPPVEFTSVTNKKRRIFEWSWEQFRYAITLNDPNKIAITFLDYINADDYGVEDWRDLSDDSKEFVEDVDQRADDINGSSVEFLKTGPRPEHSITL